MHPTGSDSQINELDPRVDEHLYGDSSTDALVSQVQQAAMNSPTSTRSGPESHAAELAGVLYTGSTPSAVEITQEQDPNIFVLPPRKTADVFVSCYWEFLHPVSRSSKDTPFNLSTRTSGPRRTNLTMQILLTKQYSMPRLILFLLLEVNLAVSLRRIRSQATRMTSTKGHGK